MKELSAYTAWQDRMLKRPTVRKIVESEQNVSTSWLVIAYSLRKNGDAASSFSRMVANDLSAGSSCSTRSATNRDPFTHSGLTLSLLHRLRSRARTLGVQARELPATLTRDDPCGRPQAAPRLSFWDCSSTTFLASSLSSDGSWSLWLCSSV
jgi:hypothetical protein